MQLDVIAPLSVRSKVSFNVIVQCMFSKIFHYFKTLWFRNDTMREFESYIMFLTSADSDLIVGLSVADSIRSSNYSF